jgi:hypothetical protein
VTGGIGKGSAGAETLGAEEGGLAQGSIGVVVILQHHGDGITNEGRIPEPVGRHCRRGRNHRVKGRGQFFLRLFLLDRRFRLLNRKSLLVVVRRVGRLAAGAQGGQKQKGQNAEYVSFHMVLLF